MKTSTFDRGVHPEYHKELTASKSTVAATLPKTVIIPLQQHAGAACKPLVKKGDVVAEGQKIGDVEAFISSPIHASISGKVKEVETYQHPSGYKALSVVIDGDGAVKDWGAGLSPVDIGSLTAEAVREKVREAGIVGMGGAAFPTSVKIAPAKGKAIDTVMLNGCECEPYLTSDHRIMVEEADKVVWGLKALMKATGAKKGCIGIEDNKPDAMEALKRAIGSSGDITVHALETKYPQGAEKMLIKAILGRKVPPGKLPLDVGVVVNNVGTAVAVYEAINWGKPLIERIITVSGNGINEPKNMKVRVGTPVEEILAQCGGVKGGAEEYVVINGGPMMGVAQGDLGAPVVKGTSGLTVISASKVKPASYDPCIRCAACVDVCPMALMPYKIGDFGRALMTTEFKEWAGLACIECGCCSFVCPSKRPLVHWIRLGKLKIRKESAAVSA